MNSRKNQSTKWLFIFDDVVMMTALILNLILISIEWLFSYKIIQLSLKENFPSLFTNYSVYIHDNFLCIDLSFVGFFLAEFLISWTIAVRKRWYGEWYYYPFIHWYDLLGCVPVGSLRFLRVLRIFSILIRLHKLDMIDLRETAIYRRLKQLYDIVLEEVSDRVVINVLGGIQQEIKDGGDVVERVANEIVAPYRQDFTQWLSQRLSNSITIRYSERKDLLREYIETLIGDAFRKNDKVELMKAIPMVGRRVSELLEAAISDIVVAIVNNSVNDLNSSNCEILINEGLDIAMNTVYHKKDKDALQRLSIHIISDIIDILKDQVKVKKWKMDSLLDQ